MNKIFILGHEITMEKKRVASGRWAVLYVSSDSCSKISLRCIFSFYEDALACFSKRCNYLDTAYDGYQYVALLYDWGDGCGFTPIAWRDNLGRAWDMEDIVDG